MMTQALIKLTTFDEFIEWKPDGERYELHNGVVVEMAQPIGKHEKVTGFLARKLTVEFDRFNLPYFIPNQALVKPMESDSAYLPDVLLIDSSNLVNEPLWEKASTVTQGDSIPLVIEVVSTNWRDDYYRKYGDYEEIGIKEYWIVDYLALGAYKFLGKPKQPTISIHYLVDGEYQVQHFKGNARIQSQTFPELNLTAEQIFQAGNLPI